MANCERRLHCARDGCAGAQGGRVISRSLPLSLPGGGDKKEGNGEEEKERESERKEEGRERKREVVGRKKLKNKQRELKAGRRKDARFTTGRAGHSEEEFGCGT